MEAVAIAIITGCVSILLAVLQQGWSSRKNSKLVISNLENLTNELESMSIDLLQVKMDKYISKFRSNHKFNDEELKELSETYERYRKMGGNGYYAQIINKIITKSIKN